MMPKKNYPLPNRQLRLKGELIRDKKYSYHCVVTVKKRITCI